MTSEPDASKPVVFDSGSQEMAVYSDRLVIANRGLSSLGKGGRVTVTFDTIRALDWRDATFFARGHFAFVRDFWGDSDVDPATIRFAKKSRSIWAEARRCVETR